MKVEIIKKITGYGDKYIAKYLISVFNTQLMLNDWWEGLKFFLSRSFYQGRRDDISKKVEDEVIDVLKNFIKINNNDATCLINNANFPQIEDELSKFIGKGKIGRGRDIKMVTSILEFVSKIEEKNIIKYSISKIKSGKLEEHFYELQNIVSIGPKIASFYLRDLISIYSLDSEMNEKDLIFLQPIDTWVRKVAYKVEIIDNIDEDDMIIREKIVEACLNLKISPIKFNQGAWFLGHDSFNTLLENLDKL